MPFAGVRYDRPCVLRDGRSTLAWPQTTFSDSAKSTTPKYKDAVRYRRFRSLESFGDIGDRLTSRPQLKKTTLLFCGPTPVHGRPSTHCT